MNELQSTPHSDLDNIDLRELFRVLWAGKILIGGITFAVTLIAVVIALLLPNIYRAEALLAPNESEMAGGLSALASQYGGLASLAGIDLGSGSTDKTAFGLEVLKSRKFISEFIISHDILVPLMATKAWNPDTGELEIDSDDYDLASDNWVRDVKPPQKVVPSSQEAYKEFMDILSVSQDRKTGFVTIAIEHYSPEIAKQWVDSLIDDLNASIMREDVSDAQQAIEYLNKQIENTSLAGLKNVFFSLIEEQTKTIMLASVSDEYLLKTLDPAFAPEEKSSPSRALIVLLGFVIGSLSGIVLALLIGTPKSERVGQ